MRLFPVRRDISPPEQAALAVLLAALVAVWVWLGVALWGEGGWRALLDSVYFDVTGIAVAAVAGLGGRLLRPREPE